MIKSRHQNYFLALTLLLPCSAHAIVNLEQAILGPAKDGFHTRLDLLASGSSDITENKRNKFDLLTLYQHGPHTEYLQIQYAYGTSCIFHGHPATDSTMIQPPYSGGDAR